MNELKITLKTLTPLWTGGVDQTSDRLHETGIIGSLRWWYEALLRGLGGYACDPTSDERCPDQDGNRCAACELFGCTGWARKFRLQVVQAVDKQGAGIKDALEAGKEFTLCFIELRPLEPTEKWLLIKAVEIAVKYGALGGKTTLKPQKDPKKGTDYGIVQQISANAIQRPDDLNNYLRRGRRVSQDEFPDLRWFFFLQGAFLWRKQINQLIGLSEDGKQIIGDENYQKFLRGRRGGDEQDAISKKLFSFQVNGGRIWGYAKDASMRNLIIEKIKQTIEQKRYQIKTGEEVLHEL